MDDTNTSRHADSHIRIDLERLHHNIEVIDEFLPPGTQQMAVVKADAYGHGAVRVCRSIAERVAGFAVNDIWEAVRLREGGVRNPILVFGSPTAETASLYSEQDVMATVNDRSDLEVLAPGTRFHLHVNTGMNRLGVQPEVLGEVKERIHRDKKSECVGIYSHLATADNPGSDMVTEQLELFREVRSQFDESLVTHLANTGGTAFYPKTHFDMVRIGIGMYGYPPGETEIPALKPVLSWSTRIMRVQPIKKGDTVSYGATWTCPEDGYIAVLPVGYEDGIPRILSGLMKVSIEGRLIPVVGTITMNYIMAYFSDGKPETGTGVELLGDFSHGADDWAEGARTIPYEILTGLLRSIPRDYHPPDQS